MANLKLNRPKKHLIIPDSHAHPQYSNKRYDWLGKLILDIKPDVVVNLGDMADMASLCSYDKGKKSHEGKRYTADCNVAAEASDRIWHPTRIAKRKFPGRRVLTVGNHENRIDRATELQAELSGVLSLSDLGYDRDWEVIPFLEPIEIDGVYYAHYHTSGVMGKPISGEHPAYSLVTKRHVSCVQGHTHALDYCRRNRPDGRHIIGLVAGCYIDYNAEYAGNANGMWTKGVSILHDVQEGVFDFEFIGLDRIRKAYK